jgi:hypothetical protein
MRKVGSPVQGIPPCVSSCLPVLRHEQHGRLVDGTVGCLGCDTCTADKYRKSPSDCCCFKKLIDIYRAFCGCMSRGCIHNDCGRGLLLHDAAPSC